MKKRVVLIYIMLINISAMGQDSMIVDNFRYGMTYYGGFSREIKSLSQIKASVRNNVEKFLLLRLGDLKPNVIFSHGQEIDLKSYFEKHSDTYNQQNVIPKYDLEFILKDSSLGVKSFDITMKLDEYGQILSTNWPREGVTDTKSLKSRTAILNTALDYAKRKQLNTAGYKVDLKFEEDLQKLCWIFLFPQTKSKSANIFDAIEIDWQSGEIVSEYQYRTSL